MKEFGEREQNKTYVDRPGAYGLILHNAKVLIIEIDGKFFLPGGGLNKNEDPEECLKRELLEETGYAIEIIDELDQAIQYLYSTRDQNYYKKIGHFYKCNLLHQQTSPVDINHVMQWMDPPQAIRKLNQEFQAWAVRSLDRF